MTAVFLQIRLKLSRKSCLYNYTVLEVSFSVLYVICESLYITVIPTPKSYAEMYPHF